MLNGMMWLLGCQLVGEVLVRSLDLPVPGPVVGMVILFALLQWRRPETGAGLLRISDRMLRHLQLLFIPPGVGIVAYLARCGTTPCRSPARCWSRGWPVWSPWRCWSSSSPGAGVRRERDHGLPAFLAPPGVFLTLAGYRVGLEMKRLSRNHPLAQPVLVAIVVIGVAMWLLDIEYDEYLVGGSVIAFFLGPATVALAVPLHRQAHHLKELAVPMLIAIPVGAFVSIATGVLMVRVLGGGDVLERTMAAKSTTTPIAIAVTDHAGGNPSMVAVLTIVVGMLGAVLGPTVLTLLHIRDRRAVASPWALSRTASAPHVPCRRTRPRGPSPDCRWVSPRWPPACSFRC